jgi:PST family polysaccharide transporter
MNIKKKAMQGLFWSGVQTWGSQAGALIIFLVLARLLSPEDFGLVALANTFVIFSDVLVDQGLNAAIVQRQDIEPRHLNSAFWTQLFIGSCFTAVGISSSTNFADIFNQPSLAPVLRYLSLIPVLRSLIMVQQAILRREFAFQKIAVRALVGILTGGTVGVLMAVLGFGVWSLVGQQLTFEIAGVLIFWGLSHWRPRLRFSWSALKELSSFGLSIFGSKILTFFNQNTDNLLIGYFLGETALGYYAVAYRVLQVLTQLLVDTINQVALATFSRLQQDRDHLLRVFFKVLRLSSLISLPIFLAVSVLSQELVVTIFGYQWQSAAPIMQVLSFGGTVYLILFFNQTMFASIGRPGLMLRLEILNVAFNVFACLVAIRWGVLAVAFAFVFSDFLVIPVSLWLLKITLRLSLVEYFRQFFPALSCTTIMLSLMIVLKLRFAGIMSHATILLLCTLLGGIAYGLCLRLFNPLLFQEIKDLFQLVQKKS